MTIHKEYFKMSNGTPFKDPNTNYTEDALVKLACFIDRRAIAEHIFSVLKTNNLPLTYENAKQILLATDQQVFNEIALKLKPQIQVHSREIGTILREYKCFTGKMYAVIVDNKPVDEIPDDWEPRMECYCPNPLCICNAQYAILGDDNKYSYYCPECNLTWKWKLL